jgi:hypothetical protein
MRTVVVYESMYGNTHLIAEAVAAGMREAEDTEVVVVAVDAAFPAVLADADLLVVGGPTHVHGLSRESTRKAAAEAAEKDGSDLVMELDAEGEGLREWFDTVGDLAVDAAAFDTRLDAPAAFTGRASKGIAKRLRRHGCSLVVGPESFLVTKQTHLEDGEQARARAWGASVARARGDAAIGSSAS